MTAPLIDSEPDPRWSLSNERTLLAYMRTALAFIVAGLAIAGSHSFADTASWFAALGLPFIAVGCLIAASSRRRFVAVQAALRTGEPLPPARVTAALPWGLAVLGAAVFGVAFAQLL